MITVINQVQKKIDDTDKKTPHTSDFVKKKTDYNAKITKIECKILSIIGLATTTALAVVILPKIKTEFDTKVLEIHSEKFSTSDYNKFTRNIPDAKKDKLISLLFSDSKIMLF